MAKAKPIGEILIDARYRKGRLTQQEVANAIDVSQPAIATYENGTRSIPEDKAVLLSEFLGIPLKKFSKGA